MLHHIAIGTPQLEIMVEFYSKLPGLSFLEWKLDEAQNKRSGWFVLQDSSLLMIEKRTYSKAPEALVFSLKHIDSKRRSDLPSPTSQTRFSFYFQDPDQNTIGYSNFPDPLEEWEERMGV